MMSCWIHLNSHSFVFKKEEASSEPTTTGSRIVFVDKETYDKIAIGSRYVDGKWLDPIPTIVEDDPIRNRINDLIEELRNTDWIIVEIIEYQLMQKESPHNVEEINRKRQEWRNEIAKLKASIDNTDSIEE